ncbi:Aorsin [Cladobotryum mycophilum]|uniref:tripeptidyl-peptidase II n=1 Tax=Cladobotryum mycophilum TaxID=491253 RepID=A0ABR0SR28_9HYPO
MHFTAVLQAAALLGLSSAHLIPKRHVVHEKRQVPNPELNIRVARNVVLPVRIGLRQNAAALAKGESWLMEVSHPSSAKYGQHWSQEEVIKAFQPSHETVQSVKRWLIDSGIQEDRITHSENKGWLAFDASVGEVEGLLHTEYFHDGKDHALVSANEYHVPEHITEHVHYITPGVKGVTMDLRRSLNGRSASGSTKHRRSHRKPFPELPAFWATSDVSTCDKVITPACLQALYNFKAPDPNAQVSANNSLGIFEWGDFYGQGDFDSFFAQYAQQVPKGTGPTLNLIDGAKAPVPVDEDGGESNLDFELAYPIIYPQKTTLYQVDDAYYTGEQGEEAYAGFLNTFFDAIDGSYCTYSAYGETGDDAKFDPVYPDKHRGGYQGKTMCGTFKPTNVISISYGGQENDLPAYYQQRQCDEFLKLSLQGVSILVASGDDGVGAQEGCLGKNNAFSPAFPNSCPWLTNVGATKVLPGKTTSDPESAANDPSIGYSTGGGFSNIYPIPSYQASALSSFFQNHNPSYASYTGGNYSISKGLYNRNGRGYPDVSANGDNIAVWVQGQSTTEAGTSASTPIFAALINRIIEERIKVGKGPVGFINPVLYENPQVLNDITDGNNPGCGTKGFSAVSGWDPVTGLGTPNYEKLLSLFLSLP